MNKYNWEKAVDTDSTWRIGDGTAPVYNYIYYRYKYIYNGLVTYICIDIWL